MLIFFYCLIYMPLSDAGISSEQFTRSQIDGDSKVILTIPGTATRIACLAQCTLSSSCHHARLLQDTKECHLYGPDLASNSDKSLTVWSKVKYEHVLIVHQDVSANQPEDYFPAALVNLDTPTTFSIALDIEDYRWAEDNHFYLLLCYPERFETCYYFKQTNNPFTESIRTGFELLHDPLGGTTPMVADHDFAGLAADNPASAMSDGNIGGSKWLFAIGAATPFSSGFPGPNLLDSPLRAVKIMKLYAVKNK